jgi:hypothetical protein
VKRRSVVFLILVIAIAVLIPLLVRFQRQRENVQDKSVPHLEASPVPQHPHALSENEVKAVLAQDFRIVYKVEQIPDAVRTSFINVVDSGREDSLSDPKTRNKDFNEQWKREAQKRPLPPLQMADPGQAMGSDVVMPGVPNRRLVLCGYSKSAALVLFEQGGYVDTVRLVVFDFQRSAAWL